MGGIEAEQLSYPSRLVPLRVGCGGGECPEPRPAAAPALRDVWLRRGRSCPCLTLPSLGRNGQDSQTGLEAGFYLRLLFNCCWPGVEEEGAWTCSREAACRVYALAVTLKHPPKTCSYSKYLRVDEAQDCK